MPSQMRKLTLTADHVARVHKVVQDHGLTPGAELHTDANYDSWVEQMIRTHPAPKAPTRLFAYGSLIWKPEIEHIGEQVGLARGWHRAFCFRMTRFRGTPEQPGLMMALDRGGAMQRRPVRPAKGQPRTPIRQTLSTRIHLQAGQQHAPVDHGRDHLWSHSGIDLCHEPRLASLCRSSVT